MPLLNRAPTAPKGSILEDLAQTRRLIKLNPRVRACARFITFIVLSCKLTRES